MLSLIIVLVIGVLIGYLTQNRKETGKFIQLIPFIIYLLLFLLGIGIGHNKEIMENLPAVGRDALLITLGGVGGSLLAGKWLYAVIIKKGKERK